MKSAAVTIFRFQPSDEPKAKKRSSMASTELCKKIIGDFCPYCVKIHPQSSPEATAEKQGVGG